MAKVYALRHGFGIEAEVLTQCLDPAERGGRGFEVTGLGEFVTLLQQTQGSQDPRLQFRVEAQVGIVVQGLLERGNSGLHLTLLRLAFPLSKYMFRFAERLIHW